MSLGAYLSLRGYSAGFRDYYVAPMCAAVWSVPNAQVQRRAAQGLVHRVVQGSLMLAWAEVYAHGPAGKPSRPQALLCPDPPTHPPNPQSTTRRQVLDFPVRTLIHFWVNHHLLDLYQRPCWRVVSGRSKQYVDRIVAGGCRGVAWLW